MAILDLLFETKISKVFAMVTKLTGWSLGLDERLNKIEVRLGAIEMALTEQGTRVPVPTHQRVANRRRKRARK